MLFWYVEGLNTRTDREWPAAEKLFDHLHQQLKRKAVRIQPLCKQSVCLAPSENRKKSLSGEARERMLTPAPLQPFQSAPHSPCNTTWQHFLTDVQRILQWPQQPAAAPREPAQGCSLWQWSAGLLSFWCAPDLWAEQSQLELVREFLMKWFLAGRKIGETESFGRNVPVMMKCFSWKTS